MTASKQCTYKTRERTFSPVRKFKIFKDHFVDRLTTVWPSSRLYFSTRNIRSSLAVPTVQTARAIAVCRAGVMGTSQIVRAYCANTMEFVAVRLISAQQESTSHE